MDPAEGDGQKRASAGSDIGDHAGRNPITSGLSNLQARAPRGTFIGRSGGPTLPTHLQLPKVQECLDRGSPYWFHGQLVSGVALPEDPGIEELPRDWTL
jgi:hypothetical protein